MTQVVQQRINYGSKSFDVVMIGNKVDSTELYVAQERLPLYKLEGVQMHVYQGSQSADIDDLQEILASGNREKINAEGIIAQQQAQINELGQQLNAFNDLNELSPQILKEAAILFPQVVGVTLAKGTEAQSDTVQTQIIAVITTQSPLTAKNREQLSMWMKQRIGDEQVRIIMDLVRLD